MLIYFADRQFNILGNASTHLPQGLTVIEDLKTEDVELGARIFECKIPYDEETRRYVLDYTEVGNYLLRNNGEENELYSIIETEADTERQEIYIYCEDAGMDLLNEVVPAYSTDQPQTIVQYINRFAAGSGFKVNRNEIKSLTKALSWDEEQTAYERLLSLAKGFDDSEISFSFVVNGMNVVKKYINIYAKRGNDLSIPLRLNKEVNSIVTTKSIANIATALRCVGGTPDDSEEPITLEGYAYDDGDFYVSGDLLVSRKAFNKWKRLLWKDDDSQEAGGHITRHFSYDTLSKSTLCSQAKAELKRISDAEVNYEADIVEWPSNVHVGDRVNIVDDKGGLYLSARILTLETSVANNTRKAVLGEYLLKKSGISKTVQELASKFAKSAVSTSQALAIAKTAKTQATTAQGVADSALEEAGKAQTAANEATTAANTATQSAAAATEAANNAQQAVDAVEENVAGIQETVDNANAAAQQAQQAAATAETKATEAQQAAVNAQVDATAAAGRAQEAESKADEAKEEAAAATAQAGEAKTTAEQASTTAAAAKTDAENAQKEIDSLGENLTTLSNTMSAEYSRKTELTEAKASLQAQITQNANSLAITHTKVTEIDETTNNAAALAQQAKEEADAAQTKADQATASATAAQNKADEAATAASSAQNEADAAKKAAADAQSVADKAKEDLAKAEEDLATVQGRVDATEEDILAAQDAVTAAQAAADKAQEDAADATTKANAAQSAANTAAAEATAAQTTANNAAAQAATAQQVAQQAEGNATAAQNKANEAANTAAAAQEAANEAKTNATNAQTAANNAAATAQAAQTKADNADAKAAQAQTDLATAQQNLIDVTSRVGATEEEVEAAKADVVKAQAAADAAQAEAEAAQSTADTAKADAKTAQEAADAAKADAKTAQEAADAAKAVADQAAEDVGALEIRVTTAETDIIKNSNEIALRAKKTEVAETLSGYSTTEQMNSAITLKANEIAQTVSNTYQTKDAMSGYYTKSEADTEISAKADEINLSVSEKIAEIEVGGRNLLRWTQDLPVVDDAISPEGISLFSSSVGTLEQTEDGAKLIFASNAQAGMTIPLVYDGCIDDRETVTLSFEYRGNITAPGKIYFLQRTTPNVSLNLGDYAEMVVSETEWQHFTATFYSNSANARVNYQILLFYDLGDYTADNWVEIKAKTLKLEKGNKATDWSPAPEDMANTEDVKGWLGGYYTKAETDAAISIESDKISSVVESVDTIKDGVDGNVVAISTQKSRIDQLSDQISALVEGEDGKTLLMQTEEGWTFDFSAFGDPLDDRINAFEQRIQFGVENGEPCIILAAEGSNYSVVITNTKILFKNGSSEPMYLQNNTLVADKLDVADEIAQGDFVWVQHNGNLGLMRKENE